MSLYPKKESKERGAKKIIRTGQMNLIIARTLGVHLLSSLIAWIGRSRLGKTTTAQELNREINAAFTPDDPDAFRSVYYQVGEIVGKRLQKQGIRSLYEACIGPMEKSTFNDNSTEGLATLLVEALKIHNIQMIFIDEAGNLPINVLRGMVTVRDRAFAIDWTLSLVFIGMDDLPRVLLQLPQINNRINEWCYFKPYTLEETFIFLSSLEPYFSSYSLENPEQLEQIQFIHEQFDGTPGLFIPFLRRLLRRLNNRLHTELGGKIDLIGLMSVHLNFLRDKDAALSDSEKGYTGKVKQKGNNELLGFEE